MRFGIGGGLITALLLLGESVPKEQRYVSPVDVALSADGERIYIVCEGTEELIVVAAASQAIIGRVPVGRVPRGIAMSTDGKRVYVTNSWADTISEIDSASLHVTRTL